MTAKALLAELMSLGEHKSDALTSCATLLSVNELERQRKQFVDEEGSMLAVDSHRVVVFLRLRNDFSLSMWHCQEVSRVFHPVLPRCCHVLSRSTVLNHLV